MAETYTIFPDVVIEGTLPLTEEIAQQIAVGISKEKNAATCIETNYGWRTDEFNKLQTTLLKLQSFLASTFYNDIKKQHAVTSKMKIELTRPSLISIKPQHTVDRNNTTRRWYSGMIWLQTTNKGSELKLHAPQLKTHSTPHGLMPFSTTISPEQFKYVFWPAHIEHSFTPNCSFTDTVILQCTITGGIPGVPGPGKPGV